MQNGGSSILIALLLLAGCGSGGAHASPVVEQPGSASATRSGWSSYDDGTLHAGALDRELHGGLTVAPDRALALIEARVVASTRQGAVERIREVATALEALAAPHEGCTIALRDLAPVLAGDELVASATLALAIDVAGLDGLTDRQSRSEACVGVLDRLDPATFEGVTVRRSTLLWTIVDPSRHRADLLARRFAALEGVAAAPGAPSQFHADRLRCTSSGEVLIAARSMRGIDLEVDFACAPEESGDAAGADDPPAS
jgi:hypothetical protein